MKTINLKSGDYEITLLTIEECKSHGGIIPWTDDCWWLRSPGAGSSLAAYVIYYGDFDYYGDLVDNSLGIRPALKSKILNLPIGEKFAAICNRWVMIDDGFAISEDVISRRRYDADSNEWETSELKEWLEKWAREGEDDA